jgi:hypothetical protein
VTFYIGYITFSGIYTSSAAKFVRLDTLQTWRSTAAFRRLYEIATICQSPALFVCELEGSFGSGVGKCKATESFGFLFIHFWKREASSLCTKILTVGHSELGCRKIKTYRKT